MRPRHVCLGCAAIVLPHDAAERGFNEAEACLPRMRHGCMSVTCACRYASMRPRHVCLGCLSDRLPVLRRADLASMRPRHVCLGCAGAPCVMTSLRASFNEAEACLPRMRRTGSRCRTGAGRRFNEAEACLPRMLARCLAWAWMEYDASMRPRHVCLGCLPRCSFVTDIVALQ